jgi:hypothetical protein
MTNSAELVGEAIRNARALRRYAQHPNKARKHRYERRKIRGYIRLGSWIEADGI